MSYHEDTIDWQLVHDLSQWLDNNVSDQYKNQPLAQGWARIAKIQEELGETIAEFISWTGQNPRKPQDPNAYHRMMVELADTVMTGIYAMNHFFAEMGGDTPRYILMQRMKHHAERIHLYG